MKARMRTGLAVALLMLFLGYQLGITAFTHVHYVNGVMVVHSHPFANCAHQHTNSQLVLLVQLDHWVSPEADNVCWIPVLRSKVCELDYPLHIPLVVATHLQHLRLRAPPVFPVHISIS